MSGESDAELRAENARLKAEIAAMKPLVEKLIWWAGRQTVDSVDGLITNYRKEMEAIRAKAEHEQRQRDAKLLNDFIEDQTL